MRHARKTWVDGSAACALLWLASGCMVFRPASVTPPAAPRGFVAELASTEEATPAPDSTRPNAAAPGAATPDAAALEAPGAPKEPTAPGARGAEDVGPSGRWWAAFADPALDAAIEEALRHNYTIADLRHLIYEGQLDPANPRGWLWPLRIDVPASVQRSRVPSGIPTPSFPARSLSFSQADVGVTAAYQVDLFGQLAVQRQTFADLTEQQRQNTEIFAQALAEQVTQLWFDILEQRALAELLQSQVRYSAELARIVEARFEQNLTSRLAVLQQRQQLLDTEARVPLVESRLALLGSTLTALLGRTPTPDGALVPISRHLPELPPAPDVGAPADLLQRSPELRLAHARVAEIEDQVSQNMASRLPTIELFGNVGVTSYEFSDDFITGAAGVRLVWSLFDGGRRASEARQLELRMQRRVWQYELALKTQVQRVQDALVQERKQAVNSRALHAQIELGRLVLGEARAAFERGGSDYLPVLAALTNLTNLERSAIQAQRLLLSHRVQLYHALGGSWSSTATQYAD